MTFRHGLLLIIGLLMSAAMVAAVALTLRPVPVLAGSATGGYVE
jgi:hypothetical protein